MSEVEDEGPGPNQTLVMVLDAVYKLHEEEAEGEWSAERVAAEIRQRNCGLGPGSNDLERALQTALEAGYLNRSEPPAGGYSLATPIDNFMDLLNTSFQLAGLRDKGSRLRNRTRSVKYTQSRNVRAKIKNVGRKGGDRCEGCERVRKCQCGVGCGCRVTCTVCKTDTVDRPKTAEARRRRFERRKRKQMERQRLVQELMKGQPGRKATPRNRRSDNSNRTNDQ